MEEDTTLPGIFFSLLAFSWFLQYSLARRRSPLPSPLLSPSSSCTSRLSSSLPWAGLASLLLAGLAIILTVLLPSSSSSTFSAQQEELHQAAVLQRVTMYLAFALPGILATVAFYTSLSLPRHLPLLSTALAFLLQTALLSSSSPLLLLIVLCSLLLSLARLLLSSSPSSSSSLLLCLLLQTQGSWLLHTSLSPPPPSMAATYLSWHILAIFTTYILLLITIQSCQKATEKPSNPSSSSSAPSSSTGSTSGAAASSSTTLSSYSPAPLPPPRPGRESELFYEQEVNDTKIAKIRCVLATIDHMMEGERSSLDTSADTLSEEVETEVREERERVSPLEEWNTLHRCVRENRASIKLKESSIV